MELSSKIDDKLFVEWTKDDNLFARMHSYGSLRNLIQESAQLSGWFQTSCRFAWFCFWAHCFESIPRKAER